MPTFEFGTVRVQTLEVSRFGLDGGAMFGIVPRALWAKRLAPDEGNRIPMVTRVLLVASAGRVLLVDAGFGGRWTEKERSIYALEGPDLRTGLEEAGVDPETITDVVVTHLHFDHASGLVEEEGGRLQPALPRAVHHIQRLHWAWAERPAAKDAGSFRREELSVLRDGVSLHLVDGFQEILPGVRVWPVFGHTRAMQLVLLGTGRDRGLFCADLVPTRWHLRPAWNMAYDNEPLKTVEEKKLVFRLAFQEGWTLLLEHDPEVAAVRLADLGGGFQVLA